MCKLLNCRELFLDARELFFPVEQLILCTLNYFLHVASFFCLYLMSYVFGIILVYVWLMKVPWIIFGRQEITFPREEIIFDMRHFFGGLFLISYMSGIIFVLQRLELFLYFWMQNNSP